MTTGASVAVPIGRLMHNVSVHETWSKSFKPPGPLPLAEGDMGTQGLQYGYTEWLGKTTFIKGHKRGLVPNMCCIANRPGFSNDVQDNYLSGQKGSKK